MHLIEIPGAANVRALEASVPDTRGYTSPCSALRQQTEYAQNMYNHISQFEWDETKSERNKKQRGFGFDEARYVFDDPHAEEFYDESHSDGEARFAKLGYAGPRLLWVVFTALGERGERIRILSARKATRKERKSYEEKSKR